MATKRGKQKAPERPILFWVKDVPFHASSDMQPCRKGEPVPRKRRLGFLKSECVRSNDGIDFWLDSVILEGAVATRLRVDASRRDPELFAEDIDPGLLGRLLFMLVNSGSEPKAPTLVLWGCRPRTRGRRWELYFLGREATDFCKILHADHRHVGHLRGPGDRHPASRSGGTVGRAAPAGDWRPGRVLQSGRARGGRTARRRESARRGAPVRGEGRNDALSHLPLPFHG